MIKKIIIVFLLAAPLAVFSQVPLKGPLDGKTFIVDTYKEGKKKPLDTDELKFITGKFKSKYFADWGFTKASVYKITSIDSTSSETKIYSWTAEATSDIKEKMTWTGTITGEEIEGTSEIVSAKGEKTYSFTFTGKLKGKPGKK
jgi:hypothetical protein